MTSIDCDEYVDMGEHNKPLCKKSGYRPAECELCPTRVSSLEAENAKLREFVYDMWNDMNVYYTQHESPDSSDMDFWRDRMRELGIEA